MIYLVPVERDIAIEDHMVSYIFTTIYYTLPYTYLLCLLTQLQENQLVLLQSSMEGLPHPTAIISLIKKLNNTLMSLPSKQTVIMCRYNGNYKHDLIS